MERTTSEKNHLSDDQWIECLLGEPSAEAPGHLSACSACRAELLRFRTATEQLARQNFAYAEALPEPFWQEQRRRIAARAVAAKARTTRSAFSTQLAFALSVVAVAVFAVMLLRSPSPSRPTGAAQLPVSDDAVLAQVQEALDQDVPSALAPVTLLTDEMERGISSKQAR